MSPSRPPNAPRSRLVLAYAAVSLIWGSTYLGIRVALGAFPPFALGAIRFLAAGGVLYATLRLRGHRAPTPREWRSAIVTGALFFVIGNGLVNVAEQSVSSGLASVMVATMPLWATLLARFAGERPSGGELAGIALGLVGVLVMNLGADLRASGAGAVFALLAPMGWATGTIASKRLALPPGPMSTAAQMLAGGAALAVTSAATGEHLPAAPSARAVVAVAYLAAFGSLVGFSAYTYLVRHTRASIATSYAYVNPVVAVALGLAVAGEHMDATTAAGAAIVLAAVLVVSRSKSARAAAPPAPAAARDASGAADADVPSADRA